MSFFAHLRTLFVTLVVFSVHVVVAGSTQGFVQEEHDTNSFAFHGNGFSLQFLPGCVHIYRYELPDDSAHATTKFYAEKYTLHISKSRVVPSGQKPFSAKFQSLRESATHHAMKCFRRVLYANAFPGIDLVFYADRNALKYDFVLHPGARPADIQLEYTGCTLQPIENGIRICGKKYSFEETIPLSYRDKSADQSWERKNCLMHYRVTGNTVSFSGTAAKKNEIIVIDPWATYFGGSDVDECMHVAHDSVQNVYAVGYTYSIDLPTDTTSFQDTLVGSYDVFLSKFDPGGQLVWCTYYGRSANDFGTGVIVTPGGPAICGYTSSPGLAVGGSGAFSTTHAGTIDAFLTQFDFNGQFTWGTFYGGTAGEFCSSLAMDSKKRLVIAGYSASANLPMAGNSFQTTMAGALDMFAARFSSTGGLLWSTYFGGIDSDDAHSLWIDADDAVILCGDTYSSNLPVSSGCFQSFYAGNDDAYLVKFDSSGNRVFATYYGGSGLEDFNRVVTDKNGRIYAAGFTNSSDIDLGNHFTQQGAPGGNNDFLISCFTPGGMLQWSTYYGGGASDIVRAMAINPDDVISIAGETYSTNFPLTGNTFQSSNQGNADVGYLNIDTTGHVIYATYWGGSNGDNPYGMAASTDYRITVCGSSSSVNLPVTPGAWMPNASLNGDGFIWQLDTTQGVFMHQPEIKNDASLLLWPNPVTDVAVIETGNFRVGAVTLTDMRGRKINVPVSLNGHRANVQCSMLEAGTYIVYVQLENADPVTLSLVVY